MKGHYLITKELRNSKDYWFYKYKDDEFVEIV